MESDSGSNDKCESEDSNNSQIPAPLLLWTYSGCSNNSSSSSFYKHESRSFQEVDRVRFMEPSSVIQSIQKLIGTLSKMAIDENLIMYLLHKYQWNKQKLQNYYYDLHAKSYQQKDEIFKSISRKPNQVAQMCLICCNHSKLIKADLCQHSYCQNCWSHYIEEKISANQLFFGCMNGCSDCPILQPFIRFINHLLLEQYYKKLGMNYCLANKNISYCPSPECELFCEKASIFSHNKVECLCGNIYCFYCRKQVHMPISCDDMIKWEKTVNSQSKNCEWISKNTIVCPHCKNNVERSLGCDLMKCICGCDFCYKCSGKWDQTHKIEKQCPKDELNFVKKQSYQQKMFISAYEKFIDIKNIAQKDNATIQKCLQVVNEVRPDGKFQNELVDLKSQLTSAWLVRKWALVGNYLYGAGQHNIELQGDLAKSITELMDEIKSVLKMHHRISQKELHILVGHILAKMQQMIKCYTIFLEAWRP